MNLSRFNTKRKKNKRPDSSGGRPRWFRSAKAATVAAGGARLDWQGQS